MKAVQNKKCNLKKTRMKENEYAMSKSGANTHTQRRIFSFYMHE